MRYTFCLRLGTASFGQEDPMSDLEQVLTSRGQLPIANGARDHQLWHASERRRFGAHVSRQFILRHGHKNKF